MEVGSFSESGGSSSGLGGVGILRSPRRRVRFKDEQQPQSVIINSSSPHQFDYSSSYFVCCSSDESDMVARRRSGSGHRRHCRCCGEDVVEDAEAAEALFEGIEDVHRWDRRSRRIKEAEVALLASTEAVRRQQRRRVQQQNRHSVRK
jgi:hypothetical protein